MEHWVKPGSAREEKGGKGWRPEGGLLRCGMQKSGAGHGGGRGGGAPHLGGGEREDEESLVH